MQLTERFTTLLSLSTATILHTRTSNYFFFPKGTIHSKKEKRNARVIKQASLNRERAFAPSLERIAGNNRWGGGGTSALEILRKLQEKLHVNRGHLEGTVQRCKDWLGVN